MTVEARNAERKRLTLCAVLLAPGYASYAVGQYDRCKTAEEVEADVAKENMEELHDKFRSHYGDGYKVESVAIACA